MRGMIRGVAVVCLVVFSLGAFASPRDPGAGAGVKKIVKKIKSLGDLLTVPGAGPAKP
jgi:hypothetical protein